MVAPPAKLLLTKDEHGAIVCKDYGYFENGYVGTSALCDDGSRREFKFPSRPPRWDFLGLRVQHYASYGDLKSAFLDVTDWPRKAKEVVLTSPSWDDVSYDLGEFGWLKFDADRKVLSDSDTLESMRAWLEQPIADGEQEIFLERIFSDCSEYAAGFSLMAALSKQEVKALQLREVDLGGGPGHSVLCVVSSASISDLNRVIAGRGLPYVFVD